jgi:type IV secretory pathway VirB10-like protein
MTNTGSGYALPGEANANLCEFAVFGIVSLYEQVPADAKTKDETDPMGGDPKQPDPAGEQKQPDPMPKPQDPEKKEPAPGTPTPDDKKKDEAAPSQPNK